MDRIVPLEDVIKMFGDGRGLYIAERAFKDNKRYCCGQPQLKTGVMEWSDTPIYFVNGCRPDFPQVVLDCNEYLAEPAQRSKATSNE